MFRQIDPSQELQKNLDLKTAECQGLNEKYLRLAAASSTISKDLHNAINAIKSYSAMSKFFENCSQSSKQPR